jgi:hypothetical protein
MYDRQLLARLPGSRSPYGMQHGSERRLLGRLLGPATMKRLCTTSSPAGSARPLPLGFAPGHIDGAVMMFVSAGTVHRKTRQDKMENGLGHRRTVTSLQARARRPTAMGPRAATHGHRLRAGAPGSRHGLVSPRADSRQPVLGLGTRVPWPEQPVASLTATAPDERLVEGADCMVVLSKFMTARQSTRRASAGTGAARRRAGRSRGAGGPVRVDRVARSSRARCQTRGAGSCSP